MNFLKEIIKIKTECASDYTEKLKCKINQKINNRTNSVKKF